MCRRWAARFLDHWRPDVAGFVESELWPNLLAACRARGIPTMLINARLSERSLARWRRVPGLARQVLDGFARVQPRSETDAERLRALGCCRVGEPGDLKLAAPPLPVDETELRRLRDLLAGRPVWFAASTHPGEETLILAAHGMLASDHPGLLTIIAPRHPERGAAIPAAQRTVRAAMARRRRASGSSTRWESWACGTGWPASPSSAAACCLRAAGRTRLSRPVSAAPSQSGRTPATSLTTSPCCTRPAG